MTPPGWAKEPLVHFLAAGAVIFLVLAWQGEPVDPASRSIAVTREDRARLALQWERTMSRPPTDAELDGLTERFVREEVLYREALRLGLDRDDAVLRKRLADKMDFLAGSMAETAAVSDATLQDWLDRYPERFAEEARYSFDQVYFRDEADAMRLLDPSRPFPDDWRKLGDRISLPQSMELAPLREIADRFGDQFLAALTERHGTVGWGGPFRSGYGWHLVRVREERWTGTPDLAEVRDRVETDWRAATKAQREEDAYRVLRDAYQVTVER